MTMKKMLFNIVFIFVCFFCLSLSSCYNGNIVTEEQGKPIVIEHNMIMTPQEMGQFHNDVLNCMIEKSEANQISDFNGFMKQIMDVSQFEMAKREFFYDYTSQDSLFVNTAFRVFRDLVREDQQQALDFLVLISDYPDDVKLELMELTRESPDVDYFVNRLNEIVNGQESTRCIEDNVKQSFDIISSISISSNNYWSKKLNSRSSFGTYLADGLGGAAATISGIGVILSAVASAAASYLWEKAIEPCYTEQKNIDIVVKPDGVFQIHKGDRLELVPIQVSEEFVENLKSTLTIH